MNPPPTIEELNQRLHDHRFRQYCNLFKHAVDVFFSVGTRKRKTPSSKPVGYLTDLILLFMWHAGTETALKPGDVRKVKRVRKNIEALIAAVPTQEIMAKACSDQIESEKKLNLAGDAIFRAHLAIAAMDQLHDFWTISSMFRNVLNVDARTMYATRWKSLENSRIFFFDIADILRQEDKHQE